MTPGELEALRICFGDPTLEASDFGAENKEKVRALREEAERLRVVWHELEHGAVATAVAGAFVGLGLVSLWHPVPSLLGGVLIGLAGSGWFQARSARRTAERRDEEAERLELDDLLCCLGFYDRPTWEHPSKPSRFHKVEYQPVPDDVLAKATPAIARMIRGARRQAWENEEWRRRRAQRAARQEALPAKPA